jgi:hypothetical protein
MERLTKSEVKMINLLGKRLTGSSESIKSHKKRALKIARAIHYQYGVNVYQYQLKHIKWFLDVANQSLKSNSQYNYWLTIKEIAAIIGKSEDWLPRMQGPWVRP